MAKKSSGRRAITMEIYGQILQAFRQQPGNYNAAAKAANVNWRTAKRAWEQGWTSKPGMIAIKTVLEQEQALARQMLAGESHKEGAAPILDKAAAKYDAVQSRADEAKVVRAARGLVLQSMGSLLRMGKGVQELATALNVKLEQMAAGKKFKPEGALKLLRQYAWAIRDINNAGKDAMEMERLYLGEPTKIHGFSMVDVEDFSAEEAEEEFQAAIDALARAKEKGVDLEVLEGGMALASGMNGSKPPNGSG